MNILIKGMEMPTEGTVIAIYKLNGQFYASVHGTELCPLIPIPPHGRLIDADALRSAWDDSPGMEFESLSTPVRVIRALIDDAPTIIEAEEGE